MEIDKTQFECLEVFRDLLFNQNRDLAEKLTYGAPMLQTLGEVAALMGIPVDLTLHHAELVAYIWDMCELLRRRGTITLYGGSETIEESIKELHSQLTSEVLLEYATGIIVTQDEIAVAPADDAEMRKEPGKQREIELLPETLQKAEKRRLH